MRSFVIAIALLLISSVRATNVISEVTDPSLSVSAMAAEISANSSSFFIVNFTDPITGPGAIVGWYYTPGSPIIEVTDESLSGSARPNQVSVDSTGSFFITNDSYISGPTGLIGWYYTPGSPILEVTDPDLPSMSMEAIPNNVGVNGDGSFFISNFTGNGGLIGWLYTPGSPIEEMIDMSTPACSPGFVVGDNSTNFFIVNQDLLLSAPALVGWYYTPGMGLIEISDIEIMQVGAPESAAVNEDGNFFIPNTYGGVNLIGWFYLAGLSTATEANDFGPVITASPSSVASDSNNGFFIANGTNIGPGNSIVGWYYTAERMLLEVTENLSSDTPYPNGLSGNGSGYFISNGNELIGSDQFIGWHYTPGFMIVEVTDPATIAHDVFPASVIANASGNFFIVNGEYVAGPDQIIGWYYVPGSPIIEAIDPGSSPSGSFGSVPAANAAGHFFITNGSAITGAAPLVGWFYGPGVTTNQHSYKRPSNRR